MKNLMIITILFLVQTISFSQTIYSGILNHSNGYFTIRPYSTTYDDGTYAKIFYDGNNRRINFWSSGSNTYTNLRVGTLNVDQYLSVDNGGSSRVAINAGLDGYISGRNDNTEEKFRIHSNGPSWLNGGNVGIGKSSPDAKLAVNGVIHAKEVKVDLMGWPDYVFEVDYNLPDLEEVEEHIREKGHLINIPSAKEVEENGIQLGEMNRLLLEKIEELTLYIIDLEKRLKEVEENSKKNKNE